MTTSIARLFVKKAGLYLLFVVCYLLFVIFPKGKVNIFLSYASSPLFHQHPLSSPLPLSPITNNE